LAFAGASSEKGGRIEVQEGEKSKSEDDHNQLCKNAVKKPGEQPDLYVPVLVPIGELFQEVCR
jgi:hypothetical protein